MWIRAGGGGGVICVYPLLLKPFHIYKTISKTPIACIQKHVMGTKMLHKSVNLLYLKGTMLTIGRFVTIYNGHVPMHAQVRESINKKSTYIAFDQN